MQNSGCYCYSLQLPPVSRLYEADLERSVLVTPESGGDDIGSGRLSAGQ